MSKIGSPLRNLSFRRGTSLLALALWTVCAAQGFTQNALQNDLGGSNGGALDNNLQMNSTGQRMRGNPRNYQQDYRFGNLGVTGGLAGGKNFRGDVGYTGANDFRGALGSDDIFNELQGSALSQIQFVTSNFANESYLNASGMGMFEYRRDFTPAEDIYNSFQGSRINQDRIRLDRTHATVASNNLFDTAVAPNSIRFVQMQDENGVTSPVVVESNGLQGVYYRRVLFPKINYGALDTYQRASLMSSLGRGELTPEQIGSPYMSPLSSVPTELLLNPNFGNPESTAQQELSGDTNLDAYQKAIRQMINLYADRDDVTLGVDPALLEEIRKDLDRLRGIAMELNPKGVDPDGFDLKSYIESLEEDDDSKSADETDEEPKNETSEEYEERIEREERKQFIERSLEMIRNGGSINSFLEGQQGRIRTLMEKGETLLRRGSYFDAEQRFDEVLSINPGNPLALLGRATSQLGAGLYLSASLSLRKLFTNYPEMVGISLGEEFQPNVIRLKIAENKIRTRIARKTDLPSYGLCLAYVGKLLLDPKVVQEGLDLMDETDGDRFLSGFLEQVWLDVDAKNTDP
jgi:tetratricopeptide (TPR) repeat protein